MKGSLTSINAVDAWLQSKVSQCILPSSTYLAIFHYFHYRLNLTVANVFGHSNVISSLIWGAAAATTLLFIMVLVQRILSLSELLQVSLTDNSSSESYNGQR